LTCCKRFAALPPPPLLRQGLLQTTVLDGPRRRLQTSVRLARRRLRMRRCSSRSRLGLGFQPGYIGMQPLGKLRVAASATSLPKQELAAASATSVTAAAKAAAAAAAAVPRGTSVRLMLCSAEKPAERKMVVLLRSAGVAEVLKVAKAKLRLKRPPLGAVERLVLLEGGEPVCSLASLADGCIVAVTAEAPPLPPPQEAVATAGGEPSSSSSSSAAAAGAAAAAAGAAAGTAPAGMATAVAVAPVATAAPAAAAAAAAVRSVAGSARGARGEVQTGWGREKGATGTAWLGLGLGLGLED
jgi:hypothetical protein